MNIITETILAAATGAGNTPPFHCDGINPVTVILYAASGLTAAEYADLQISHDGGTTWSDVWIVGTQQRLYNEGTVLQVEYPGLYRVAKDSSTNAALVSISFEAASKGR